MENNSLAPCGVICDLCMAFQRTRNKCVGCLADGNKPYHCTVCSIKDCPEKQGNPAALCSECPKYPCRRIKDLNKRYIAKYGENLMQNLDSARKDGLAAFITVARQKWRCPACGQFLCVHAEQCLHCGAANPYFPGCSVPGAFSLASANQKDSNPDASGKPIPTGYSIVKLASSDVEAAKAIIHQYLLWLGIDLSFQNIVEELADFPGKYREPEGVFLVAKEGHTIVGCVGLRRIEPGICEMKRLFVVDSCKGRGLGDALVREVINRAREMGYLRMRLDTLSTMGAAQSLYRRHGFVEIPQYTVNPLAGAVFMEKDL
jgi:putative acetyltransferase